MRKALRSRHYSRRTDCTCIMWTKRFEVGYDIRIVQELPDHKDVRSTMIHSHAFNHGGKGAKSPINTL
jgi:hypothetical protein